jgi:DNA adenine methylase
MLSRLLISIEPGEVNFFDCVDRSSPALTVAIRRPKALPFLKWAGGKQWLARIAHSILPMPKGRYFEPFLGGASLFFSLSPKQAVLSDSNRDLIATYRAVAQNVGLLISTLKSYPHDRTFYDNMRSKRPRSSNATAARLIYLNKTAWNGLYRVNLQGRFNVPFGRYTNVTICPEERLREASTLLQGASLRCGDFVAISRDASEGDLVYFDPPYITTHNNNGFLKYNSKLFSWADQLRLSRAAARLVEKKVRVVVSNADHEPVIQLYKGFHCYSVQRNSLIGSARGRIGEVLITSFPVKGLRSEVK